MKSINDLAKKVKSNPAAEKRSIWQTYQSLQRAEKNLIALRKKNDKYHDGLELCVASKISLLELVEELFDCDIKDLEVYK